MRTSTRQLTHLALMTAVLCVTAPLQLPLGALPLTLQTFCIALTGALLGGKRGCTAVAAYLLLGAVGLPVFSGWTGGISHLLGPTGGFLIGFLPMTLLCGAGANRSLPLQLTLSLTGLLLMEIPGTAMLMYAVNMTLPAAVAAGVAPYIAKDIVCVILAVLTARKIAPRLRI